MWQTLHNDIMKGDAKALARSISLVENEVEGFENLLASLKFSASKIIGITGPPGAGKSSLADSLVGEVLKENKKAAVLCIDPSSPFHHGALLGDRVRMSQWYNHPKVFIRSLATRGSLGGVHPKTIEITSLIAAAGFDYIFIETVGVGQSEVEIAGLADSTIVVLVPEAGDEIQSMKAGLMEIADLFVVNKSDRPGADVFIRTLQQMIRQEKQNTIHIVKTIAIQQAGILELMQEIKNLTAKENAGKKIWLLAERAYYLIQKQRMKDIDKNELAKKLEQEAQVDTFNLYSFVKKFYPFNQSL